MRVILMFLVLAVAAPAATLEGWSQMHPQDWQSLMRECQSEDAHGHRHAAEMTAERLQALWAQGGDARLAALDRFIRHRDGRCCVYEHFSRGMTHQWDVVETDSHGCPHRAWIVHTSATRSRLRVVDFDHPDQDRTLPLTHRVPVFAALPRLIAGR